MSLLLGGSVAYAVEVTQNPAGNATGITQLELNGEFYDVEFVWGRGLDIIGIPVEFPNQAAADDAVTLVAQVLTDESTAVTTVGPTSNTSLYFDVPYQIIGSNARIVRGNGDGAGFWASGNVGDSVDYSGLAPDWSWATFTLVVETPTEKSSWGQVKSLYQ